MTVDLDPPSATNQSFGDEKSIPHGNHAELMERCAMGDTVWLMTQLPT